MPKAQRKPAQISLARPWKLDYGTTSGCCKNPRNAKLAVLRYMIDNGLKHVNIEDRETGRKVADVWLSGAWGFQVVPTIRRVK
jgi:hypothetical protein